jgi:large subunit ribosomal protein L15
MSSSIRLHNSKPRPGSRHRVKRLGCGESSGHGKTSGKGHKGQKARSGGSIRLGFEGGQMPLIRRIPKRGFNNTAFKIVYAPVNLAELESLFEPGLIDEKGLREKGLVNGAWDGVKILGGGEITKKFSLKVNAVSASAREKLEKAGGSIELIAGKTYPVRNSAKVLAKTSRPAKGKAQASTPGKAAKPSQATTPGKA